MEELRPYQVKEAVEVPHPSLEEEGVEELLPSQVKEVAEVPHPCLEEEAVEVLHPYPEEVVEEVEEFYYFLVLLFASEVEGRLVSRMENWYLVQVTEEVVVVVVEGGHELILRDSPPLENLHLVIVQGVGVGEAAPVVH